MIDDLAALIWVSEGVARRQALVHVSSATIRHRLDSGRWRSVFRGVYRTHTGPVGNAQRQWTALLAAGSDQVDRDGPQAVCLGGLSALGAWGLRNIETNAVHLLVPAHRRVTVPAGVVVHRSRHGPDADEARLVQPPSTCRDDPLWTPRSGRAVIVRRA